MFRKLFCAMLCALSAGGSLGATSAGSNDPTFGGNGQVAIDFATGTDFAESIAIQSDGRYVVAGWGTDTGVSTTRGYLARFLHDGTPDTSFNVTGRRHYGDDATNHRVLVVKALASGKLLAMGIKQVDKQGALSVFNGWMSRLNADGSTDPGYGVGGEVLMPGKTQQSASLRTGTVLADGSAIVVVSEFDGSTSTASLQKFTAAGVPDESFGLHGRVEVAAAALNFSAVDIAVDAQGRILLAGQANNPPVSTVGDGILYRFNADGSADSGFGTGGIFRQNIGNARNTFQGVAVQADGRILVTDTVYDPKVVNYYAGYVLRLKTDGTPDTGFAAAGIYKFAVSAAGLFQVTAQPDGTILASGGLEAGDGGGLIMRLSANGQPDAGFATGGFHIDPGALNVMIQKMAVDADGKIVGVGYGRGADNEWNAGIVRLIGTETTTNVIEFYNTALNHYFITANPDEAAAIDNGAAGPGWTRTGEAWKSGGPSRVCRFYGSPDLNPTTGKRMGPNGHFYTISEDECAIVTNDAGWKFESYDFSGWKPQANGSCAAGTKAVKRAYNNRFAVNDSNHRYATSDAIYNQMLASGWTGEGTVFCANQ